MGEVGQCAEPAIREPPLVLVTGATGYIGGRLVPRLVEAGYRVRCMARSPRKLAHRRWAGLATGDGVVQHRESQSAAGPGAQVEIVSGDAEDPASLERALTGVRIAYYLLHSMLSAGDAYRDEDRRLANHFATAAAEAGVERIIYLGGLGETGSNLSEHLTSRREVESALASTGVPVTTLRAAMIIGSGSASFEILRYLVERLPVMVTPSWVTTRCQPIAVRNVLHYLIACLEVPETIGRTLDIGGPEIANYTEMMGIMAEARGLKRRYVFPVPLLTPGLSSRWIHLVTPIDRHVARPLAEGLRNEVICRNGDAARLMPQRLLSIREAIDRALANLASSQVETAWSDAGPMPGDPAFAGGDVFVDRWAVEVRAPADEVFRAVCKVGGGHGWYAADWLWRLRGLLDRLVGGPGLRRGRRDAEQVAYGDALDFWRVTNVEQPRLLELRAEMKLPGQAELAFEIEDSRASLEPGEVAESTPSPGTVRLVQTARFVPRGLFGLVYWYGVLPLHGVVFRGLLEGIRRAAEKAAGVDPQRGAAPVTKQPLHDS